MAKFNDRTPALKWIVEDDRYDKDTGIFCSYSSLKMYRDAEIPLPKDYKPRYFAFGTELHAQFLEKKSVEKLTAAEKSLLRAMLKSLQSNKLVNQLMENVKVEQEFQKVIYGMNCCGRIDILADEYIADLKTTITTNLAQFVVSMDFLQAAMYFAATGLKDFYYIGISKIYPHRVFVFNVRDYPTKLAKAQKELKVWLAKLKIDLKKYVKANANNNGHKGAKTIVQKKQIRKIGGGRLYNTKIKRKVSHRKKKS